MVLSFPLPAPPGPSLSDAGTAALATVRALRRNGRGDQRSRAVSPDPRRIGLPRPAVYTSKFNIQGARTHHRDARAAARYRMVPSHVAARGGPPALLPGPGRTHDCTHDGLP